MQNPEIYPFIQLYLGIMSECNYMTSYMKAEKEKTYQRLFTYICRLIQVFLLQFYKLSFYAGKAIILFLGLCPSNKSVILSLF
jgi:hypothetical protein